MHLSYTIFFRTPEKCSKFATSLRNISWDGSILARQSQVSSSLLLLRHLYNIVPPRENGALLTECWNWKCTKFVIVDCDFITFSSYVARNTYKFNVPYDRIIALLTLRQAKTCIYKYIHVFIIVWFFYVKFFTIKCKNTKRIHTFFFL